MIKTGYISFITETGGGQDEDGNPTESVKISSDFIKCNLKVITRQYKTFLDGQFGEAAYSMYIDLDRFNSLEPKINLNTVYLVDLKDNNENALGRHQIQNKEYLNLSKRIKIVV